MSIKLALEKVGVVVAWGVELGILAGLFWKYSDVGHNVLFYGRNVAVYPGCLVFVCGVVISWMLTADRIQIRLWLLTGPSVVMAAFLVVMLSWQTKTFVSKEIDAAAVKRQVPQAFYDQWLEDHFVAVRSERLTCALIAASVCLLYASRFSNARRQSRQFLVSCMAEQGKETPAPIGER